MLARRTTAVLAILLLTAASARAVPWSFGGGGSRGGGGGGGTVNAGTSGQVAYYPSSGAAVSGSTVGGDCAFTAPSTFICTKTNGTAFAPSATTDTTNAANITSGTIGAARMPLGLTTAPAAGAIAVGNAGGTAYANHTVSGDASLSSAGALTITKTNGTALTGAATMALPVTVANGGTQCGLPSAFSGMPASPTNGEICSVTDATACTAGTAVTTGGGSTKCQVTYNGTSWMPGGGVTSAATGGVTSVTGAGPITSSGGTTPAIGVTLPLTGNAVTLVGDTSGASNATVTTKTNGVAFAPSATTDATNAANITSGTLGAARMPLGLIAAPAAGAIAVGNAGGTAYANHAVSGAGDLGTTTLSSAGVLNAQVANGSHITNGSIASSGLVNTGVTAGSYTSTNLTVNSEGLITAAANGSGGSSGSNPSYSTTNLTTSTTLTCPGWNRVNASGGALTEMLPPSAGMTVGAECVVQKIEAGNASPVTIAPNGTDTIVGYNGSIFLPSNEAYIVLIYGGAGRWDVVDRRNTNALRVSDFAGADPGARANACLTALGGSPGSASSIGGSCVLDQSNAASQTTITTQIVVGANNFQGQTLYVEPGQYQCEVTSTVNAGACFAVQTGNILLGLNHQHNTAGYGANIYAGTGQFGPLVRVADPSCNGPGDANCNNWSHWTEVGWLSLNGRNTIGSGAGPDWVASHAYALNTIVYPTVADSNTGLFYFAVTTAGTSSSTHPIWSSAQSIGSTINDGTVTWTAEGQPSVIDVEEPGEGAIVHDLNVRGNSSSQSVVMDDIRVGDSVAGFAGFFNIETVDARYGLNIAAVTSRVPVYSISGDQNNSIVNIIESGNGIIGINGLKAESFASGINEPAINIQGGVGKQLTLNVRNMYVAGNPGAGGCVQFQKASSGAPVSQNCDVIKISGGGASIGLDNVDASLFSNLINDTAALKKIALVEFGPVIQHFTYSSFANFGMYTSGDGNYSDGLDVFGAGISTNGVFGTLAVSALASPGAPTLSAGGAAGSTTYNYACTAKDAAGKSTAVPAFTALTTGNATLSQTNYNIINCPLPAGATQICVYKTNNTTLLGCGDAVESYSGSGVAELYDHGQGTTAVGAMTINQTGGLSAVTLTGAGTPAISGGGALSTGSNSLVGNITGTGASNTLTLPSSAACPNAVVLTLTDNTTTGGAKQTAQTATSATFSTTAADNVNYSIGCR